MTFLHQDLLLFSALALLWLTSSVLSFKVSKARHVISIIEADGGRTTAKVLVVLYVCLWPLTVALMIAMTVLSFLLGGNTQQRL